VDDSKRDIWKRVLPEDVVRFRSQVSQWLHMSKLGTVSHNFCHPGAKFDAGVSTLKTCTKIVGHLVFNREQRFLISECN
jgi:hypothetical protein